MVGVVTSAILTTLVLLNCIEIASRLLLNYSLFWAFEIYQLLGNWMYFLGITLVYYRLEDITLDYVYDRLPPGARYAARLAIQVVIAATLVVLGWYAFVLVGVQARTRTTGLGIPNHYYSLPILVGTLIMLANVVKQFLGFALRRHEDAGNLS